MLAADLSGSVSTTPFDSNVTDTSTEIIFELADVSDTDAVISQLGERIDVSRHMKELPFLVLDLPESLVDDVLDLPQVKSAERVTFSKPALAESGTLIRADFAHESGFDGSGTTVVILDIGIDSAHKFFKDRIVAERCYSSAFSSSSLCPNGRNEDESANVLEVGTKCLTIDFSSFFRMR